MPVEVEDNIKSFKTFTEAEKSDSELIIDLKEKKLHI